MCVSSMIGDHYRDKWQQLPGLAPTWPGSMSPPVPAISRQEFDNLKRDVLEMRELLKRAIKYDADNGEPACEVEEKMELLRKVAKMVGVDLNDIIVPKATGT